MSCERKCRLLPLKEVNHSQRSQENIGTGPWLGEQAQKPEICRLCWMFGSFGETHRRYASRKFVRWQEGLGIPSALIVLRRS